jgi:hypothetical protein
LIGEEELDRIFDPATYLGQSGPLTRRVVDQARAWLHATPTTIAIE